MKIAIFTNSYKPTVSGVVRSIEVIKSGLEELGNEVFIFAPKHKKAKEEKNVYRFPSLNLSDKLDFPIPIPFNSKLNKFIDKLDLDVIHTQHPFLLGNLAIKIAEKKKIPVIYTFHTQYEQYSHYAPFLPQKFIKKIIKNTVINYINRVNCVIAPSESIKQVLQEYKVNTDIRYIPNAIDLNKFSTVNNKLLEELIERYNLKDKKLLIFVGRMAKEKNLYFLIDTIALVKKEEDNIKLLLVGDGPIKEDLEKYIKDKNLQDFVEITGKIEYDKIPAFYKIAYAFVSASTTEVKPLALLEALAAGLPIVAVDAFGAKDTIINNYNGILTKLEKVELKNAIIRLINNKSLQKELSLNALDSSKQYSKSAFAKKLLQVYKEYKEKLTKF